MLKGIKITNFMGIESAEIDLTSPLNIFSGVNESGKSSIRDSILWAFCGSARELKTHNEQASLIHEGAKVGEVVVFLDNGHAFTRRKTQKTAAVVLGEIPDIGLNPAILFDPYVILTMPEAQRRELLFKVIPGLSPTEKNVFDRLICQPSIEALSHPDPDEKDEPALTIIKSVAKMAASHGFPGAEKETVIKRREAKRVRDTYKDAVEPEKTLTIDGKEYDIPTLNLPAIEATLKDLQKEKDDLLRQKGAGEARAKRLVTIQGQLDKIATMEAPAGGEDDRLQKIIDTNQAAYEAICIEIHKTKTSQEVFPVTCPAITIQQMPCPKAGEKVGQEPPEAGVLEALEQNKEGFVKAVSDARAQLLQYLREDEAYQSAMEKKTSLQTELKDLQAEPETGIDLDAEIATRQQRIDRGHAFDRAIYDYNLALGRYQDTQTKLAAAEQEVIIYDALAKALAPDGIPFQMIAEALDGINELLDEAATHLFPGRYLHLTGELEIVLQNSPYATLSKSAKYRVGIAFQYALARLTGARVLLLDEADILDNTHQAELINFLLAKIENFDQIIVFMTSAEPPRILIGDQRLQTWWLDNGKITKYGQA